MSKRLHLKWATSESSVSQQRSGQLSLGNHEPPYFDYNQRNAWKGLFCWLYGYFSANYIDIFYLLHIVCCRFWIFCSLLHWGCLSHKIVGTVGRSLQVCLCLRGNWVLPIEHKGRWVAVGWLPSFTHRPVGLGDLLAGWVGGLRNFGSLPTATVDWSVGQPPY